MWASFTGLQEGLRTPPEHGSLLRKQPVRCSIFSPPSPFFAYSLSSSRDLNIIHHLRHFNNQIRHLPFNPPPPGFHGNSPAPHPPKGKAIEQHTNVSAVLTLIFPRFPRKKNEDERKENHPLNGTKWHLKTRSLILRLKLLLQPQSVSDDAVQIRNLSKSPHVTC